MGGVNMTDKSIIKLFISRDENAIRAVMEKYGEFCIRIAMEQLPSREEAEECVNDALIELWHHVHKDKPRDLCTYIAETVVRCARGEESDYKKYISKPQGKVPIAFIAAALLLCLVPVMIFLPQKTPSKVTGSEESTSSPETERETEAVTQPLVFEHDGTEGLLYEIAEDGKSARFIGFGDCKEETVVIASVCNGLPVTEMLLGELRDLLNTENANIGNIRQYGSEYLKHLIISDTVEVVNSHIISSCINIESVYYGKNVRDLGLNWHTQHRTHHNFNSFEVSPENKIYYSRDNCIIERATKTLVRGCNGSIIPDDGSVEIIGKHAFYSVRGATAMNIPESITVIEDEAFLNFVTLKSITLPSKLKSLGEGAFYFCSQLESVDLNGYTVLPKAVFKFCHKLSEVKGSENLTEICTEAFDSCHKLEITFGKSLKKIEKYAFVDVESNPRFEGTKAEWEAIEKEKFWCLYSKNESQTFKFIFCTDGHIASGATIIIERR